MKGLFRNLAVAAALAAVAVRAGVQGTSVPPGYREKMNVVDGISVVATPEQWDNTCYALIDNASQLRGIEIAADLDLSDRPVDSVTNEDEVAYRQTIATLPVPLDGKGHRIEFHDNTKHLPLIGTIAEGGSVRNLAIDISATVETATYGGLAAVNRGAIDGVYATVDLALDLEQVLMKSMEQEGKVLIGGLVGENYGTIASSHIAARMSDKDPDKQELTIASESFIRTFHLGCVAGYSWGSVSDCYVGNVVCGEPVVSVFSFNKKIVYKPAALHPDSPTTGELKAVDKPSLSVGWLGHVANPGGAVNLCPPQMLAEGTGGTEPVVAEAVADEPQATDDYGRAGLWKLGASLTFCHEADPYPNFLAHNWDEAGRQSMTPLALAESDASPLWATDENLYKFKAPAKWTFNTGPIPDKAGNHWLRYPVPTMRGGAAQVEVDEQTRGVSVSVADTSGFKSVFGMLADANTAFYRSATVSVPRLLDFDAVALGMDTLSSANVAAALDSLPSVPSFSGSFDAAEVRRLAVRTSGLFDSVAAAGAVRGLALTDALLYVAPADSHFRRSADTVYVHLLAGVNCGTMENVAVFGNVIVDEQDLKKLGDTTVVVSLVGDNDGARLSGYIFIDSLQTTGANKKMIPIKQNLATGRNRKRTNTKMAARSNAVATAPAPRDTAEYRQGECLFSDRQFADGTVANWLNHLGEGFSGAYRPYWAQGERVPVPAADSSRALFRVQVAIRRGVGDADTTLHHPVFANGGDSITIRYVSKPARVLMGGEPVAAVGDTSATFVYRGGKTIEVEFGPTALEVVRPEPLRVAVVGGAVVVSGAEGRPVRLYDAGGRLLAETRAGRVPLPRRGVYVVWCDGCVAKVAAGG